MIAAARQCALFVKSLKRAELTTPPSLLCRSRFIGMAKDRICGVAARTLFHFPSVARSDLAVLYHVVVWVRGGHKRIERDVVAQVAYEADAIVRQEVAKMFDIAGSVVFPRHDAGKPA